MQNVVKITSFVPGGQGIGQLDSGKKVFVWGALPGETAELEVTKEKSSYAEAIATKILSESPHRVQPKDACFLSTSPWQIMDFDFELAQKISLTKESFLQHKISLPNTTIKTDHKEFFYRNKMEYSLYWDNSLQKIFPSFHKRGTHQKIPISSSSIERPEIFQAASKIISELNNNHASARDYQSLVVRCNQQGTTSAALFENRKPRPKMTLLSDNILGQDYSYSPNGFFQINLPVYELALSDIKSAISSDQVLDLYAGVGTIGLSVAPDRDLTLVELNGSAYEEMLKNCQTIKNSQNIHPVLA